METIDHNTENKEEKKLNKRNGQVLGGIVVIAVGAVLFAHRAGVELPEWMFTWQMIVITAGIYMGARRSFRDFRWLMPVAIGVVFMADRFIDDFSIGRYAWPLIIIAIGLNIMMRPNRKHYCR